MRANASKCSPLDSLWKLGANYKTAHPEHRAHVQKTRAGHRSQIIVELQFLGYTRHVGVRFAFTVHVVRPDRVAARLRQ